MDNADGTYKRHVFEEGMLRRIDTGTYVDRMNVLIDPDLTNVMVDDGQAEQYATELKGVGGDIPYTVDAYTWAFATLENSETGETYTVSTAHKSITIGFTSFALEDKTKGTIIGNSTSDYVLHLLPNYDTENDEIVTSQPIDRTIWIVCNYPTEEAYHWEYIQKALSRTFVYDYDQSYIKDKMVTVDGVEYTDTIPYSSQSRTMRLGIFTIYTPGYRLWSNGTKDNARDYAQTITSVAVYQNGVILSPITQSGNYWYVELPATDLERSLVIVVNYLNDTKSLGFSMTKEAAPATFSVEDIILAASGGKVSTCTVYIKYNGSTTTAEGTFEEVSCESLYWEAKEQTLLATKTVTFTYNGETCTTTVDVYQEANVVTYTSISGSYPASASISNHGGAYAFSSSTYSQTKTSTAVTDATACVVSISASATSSTKIGTFSISNNVVTASKNISGSTYSGYGVDVAVTGEGGKTKTDNVAFSQTSATISTTTPAIVIDKPTSTSITSGSQTVNIYFHATYYPVYTFDDGQQEQGSSGYNITSATSNWTASGFYGTNPSDTVAIGTNYGTTTQAKFDASVSANSTSSRNVTFTLSVKTSSSTITSAIVLAQAGKVWNAPTITGVTSIADIPASGGSVSSCTVSYTQTSDAGDSVSGTATASFTAVSADSLHTTQKARTAIATRSTTITVNGKTSASYNVTVYQAANAITSTETKTVTAAYSGTEYSYSTPSVSLSYGDIPTTGTAITPSSVTWSDTRTNKPYTVSAVQYYYYTWTTGEHSQSDNFGGVKTYGTTSTTSITNGNCSTYGVSATYTYSGTGVTTSNGSVSASNLHTTAKARTQITTAYVTVALNVGVSGSGSCAVYQAQNKVESQSYVTRSVVLAVSPTSISASQTSITATLSRFKSRIDKYTTGETTTNQISEPDTISSPYGYITASPSTYASISSTGMYVYQNSTLSSRSIVFTATYDGYSSSITVTQAAGTISDKYYIVSSTISGVGIGFTFYNNTTSSVFIIWTLLQNGSYYQTKSATVSANKGTVSMCVTTSSNGLSLGTTMQIGGVTYTIGGSSGNYIKIYQA